MANKKLLATSLVSSLALLSSVSAQCVTSGYVPCLVPGSTSAAAPPPLEPVGGVIGGGIGGGGSGFWSSVSGVATDGIQFGGDDSKRSLDDGPLLDAYAVLEKRQNSLCCKPSPVECLYTDDNVPFCYVSCLV
jgi:hypothetical protein